MEKEIFTGEDLILIINKTEVVEFWESSIDKEEALVLITWSPNPKELPDTDFVTRHRYNYNFLSDFLSCTACGLFCVESTELGNPHYHGWYQHSGDPQKSLTLIAMLKTMERFGNLKITKKVFKYRINSYSSKGNSLWYYKKDMLDAMLLVMNNPITSTVKDEVDWNYLSFFVNQDIGIKQVAVADSERKQLLAFYKNSPNEM